MSTDLSPPLRHGSVADKECPPSGGANYFITKTHPPIGSLSVPTTGSREARSRATKPGKPKTELPMPFVLRNAAACPPHGRPPAKEASYATCHRSALICRSTWLLLQRIFPRPDSSSANQTTHYRGGLRPSIPFATSSRDAP